MHDLCFSLSIFCLPRDLCAIAVKPYGSGFSGSGSLFTNHISNTVHCQGCQEKIGLRAYSGKSRPDKPGPLAQTDVDMVQCRRTF
jgi:hypothetical protein